MNVTWYPEDGSVEEIGNDSLPAGSGARKVIEIWPEHSQVTQTVPRVRATRVTNYNRKNSAVTLRLRILACFETHGECARFMDVRMDNLQSDGWLEIEYDNGQYTTLNNAMCSSVTFPERYGTAVMIDYTWIGSHMT